MVLLRGTPGNDVIEGGDEEDIVDGLAGDDRLTGGAGQDDLAGDEGADTIDGGDGDDVLAGGGRSGPFGLPHFAGSLVAPLLDTGTARDSLLGGSGSDRLFAGYGDHVDGGDGRDELFISFLGSPSGISADFGSSTLTIGGATVTNIEVVGWVQGSDFDDVLNLRSWAPTSNLDYSAVFGMGGNDWLIAGPRTTWLDGGDGDDVLDGRFSENLQMVAGGAGNDTLTTNAGTFAIADGGDGDDTIFAHGEIYGGAGHDTITVESGTFPGRVDGGDGNDLITVGPGAIGRIAGGAGADTLTGNSGDDQLASGDFLVGSTVVVDDAGTERDRLMGGAGHDVLSAGFGDDVDGGSGNDTLRLSLLGASGGVTLDTASLLSGQSFVLGGGTIQNIELLTYLRGSDFADIFTLATQGMLIEVDGGAGDDTVAAAGSAVRFAGGEGDDLFVSGSAGDTFDGGAGVDTVDYRNAAGPLHVQLSSHPATPGYGPADDILIGVENVNGSPFLDVIRGDEAGNDLRGFGGDDVIHGAGGDDTIHGGEGNDRLDTGTGWDTVFGGAGDDELIVRASGVATADGGSGYDTLIIGPEARSSFNGARVTGFERLSVETSSTLSNLSGFQQIDLRGAAFNLLNSSNPDANLVLNWQTVTLVSSTVRSVTGESGREEVWLGAGAAVLGDLRLGSGDDRLVIDDIRTAVTIVGQVDGGEGQDRLDVNAASASPLSLNLSRYTGFETLGFNAERGSPGVFTVSGLAGVTQVWVGWGSSLTLTQSNLASATVTATGGSIALTDGTTVRRIGFPEVWPGGTLAELGAVTEVAPSASTVIVNGGTILGDVVFANGNDRYDGRAGTIGGMIFGHAGDDLLMGGAGSERMQGGFGNDILAGGLGSDTLHGGDGSDTFRGTQAELHGDRVQDLTGTDRILITDADAAAFTFSYDGQRLSYEGGFIELGTLRGRLVASAAPEGGVQIKLVPDARHDFNADGRSDLFWRHLNGEFVSWSVRADGSYAYNAVSANRIDSSWQVVGLGDYNGDGRDDVMWRHSSGELAQWLGQSGGAFVHNGGALWRIDTGWRVVGVGDFNGDGRDDLAWQHAGGEFTSWLGQRDGSFRHSGLAANPTDASWRVISTGDYNGDGRDDVLWRHAGGELAQWSGGADGSFINNSAAALALWQGYRVVGSADFDGDGRADLFIRSADGMWAVQQAQPDGSFVSANNGRISQLDPSWQVSQFGDFNGDGRDDILWRHSSGAVAQWFSAGDGSFVHNSAGTANVDPGWVIQAPDVALF